MDGLTNPTSFVFVLIIIIVVIVYATTTSDKIKYPVLFYILSVIIVIMTTVSYLYRSERLVCAVTVLILFILVFVFFGLRWLKYGLESIGVYKGNYPSVINTCPDYMSVYKLPTSTVCVDTVGIAPVSSSSIRTLTRTSTPGPEHYFTSIYTPGMAKSAIDILKNNAVSKGLSWEGITDDLYTLWT
jgi:energy-coupling factor transporter transmembrane protein EcfT